MIDLRRQLDRFRRLLRLKLLAASLLCWLLGACVLLIGLVIAARLPLRANLLPGVLALAGLALLAALGWALAHRLSHRRVARVVERHYPALRESLLTAVELLEGPRGRACPHARIRPAARVGTRAPTRDPSNGSPPLVAAAIRQAEEALARIPPRSVLDLHRLRALWIGAAIALALAVSGVLTSRDALAALMQPVPHPTPVAAAATAPPVVGFPPPVIADLRIALQPPAYTQLPSRTVTQGLNKLVALPGTRVTISALDPPHGDLALQINDKPCALKPEGPRLAYEFTLAGDAAWALHAFDDRHGRFERGHLRLLYDRPPTIWMESPKQDFMLKELQPIKLSALAEDDYGLREVALEYWLPGEKSSRRVLLPASGVVQHVQYEWDLSPLHLQPGQSVSYRFLAWDNNVRFGSRVGVTRILKITLADRLPEEGAARLQQAADEQRQAVESLREQAEDIKQHLEDLQQQLQGNEEGKLPPQQLAELQQSAAQLQRQAEDVKQALAQSEQEVKQHGDALPELSRRLADINRLMRETLDVKLQEALRKLQEAATQQQQPQQAQQSLEQAQQAQEELMKQLDQLLALLKQAQMEGLIGELRQQIEELVRRQQDLIARRDKARNDAELRDQGREQRDLAGQTDQAADRLQQAAQKVAEQDEKLGAKLQALSEQMKQAQIPEAMRQAAGQLQDGKPAQAGPPQQQALEALQQLAAGLAGAQASVYQEMRQELTDAARELAAQALALSERQERLSDEVIPLADRMPEQLIQAKPRLEKLASHQQLIGAAAQRLTLQLHDLAGKSPLVDPGLVQQADEAAATAQQAARDLSAGAMPQAAAGQEQAMAQFNRLAAQLMQSQQGFQQASAQMAMQEYMRRLQQLAEQQRALNQMTQQGGGGQPLPMPGQQPGGQELGGQQGAIRQALQQMLGQAGQQSGVGQQLGGLPAEMNDVESQLRREQVTPRTLKQQERFLHKMLDAQRSLYEKERESRERLAEAPKPYRQPSSPPVLRATAVPPVTLRSSGAPQDLPLGYEALTRKYFEALAKLGL